MTRIHEALRRVRLLEQRGSGNEAPHAHDDSAGTLTEGFAPAVAEPSGRPAPAPVRARHAAAGMTSFTRIVPASAAVARPCAEGDRLVTADQSLNRSVDAFRSLAATLHQAQLDRALSVLTVTSSVVGEGKTLVSANLGLTLSRSYHRNVLLIDADLRCPGLHRFFGVPQDGDVIEALGAVTGGATVAVHEIGERLALVPAGTCPRDPVAAFSSDAMYQLIAAAAAAFDWVILDAPPVAMLPDAGLISSFGDATLLVVEAGRVRYELVQRTVESLGADRLFGVVLNKVPEWQLKTVYGGEYYAPYAPR